MPIYKRESGILYYDITLVSGNRIRVSTLTKDKRQAGELHDKLEYETWRCAHLGEKTKYLWDEAALRWIKEKTGVKKSIKADISRLLQLTELRGFYLNHINRNLITSVINEKNCSDSAKNRYLA